MKQLAVGGTALMLPATWAGLCEARHKPDVPPWLAGYAELYESDPRKAALSWFGEARFGLFMHYGLYSLLGEGEWVQLRKKIPVASYEKLRDRFTAEDFDPDFIADLAVAAGMKYVNLTAKHHEGFCLFKTAQTDYNSLQAPSRRDLVGELKKACDKRRLGLFLYYSMAADWHHPYFYSRETGWEYYRPAYERPQPEYRYDEERSAGKYIAYARAQLRELASQYRPAGIWFDPIMGYYARPDLFPMEEIYKEIRSVCPHTLVSFKQGATGTEDFAAPERGAGSLYERVKKSLGEAAARTAEKAWEANKGKHNETCNTMQPGAWGYRKNDDGKHLNAAQVLSLLREAESRNMNLLLNTGPLPGGGIHGEDAATLRETGRLLNELPATDR